MNLPNERLIDTVIGLPKTACLCHPCNYWFLNYPLLCIYVHQLDAEKNSLFSYLNKNVCFV